MGSKFEGLVENKFESSAVQSHRRLGKIGWILPLTLSATLVGLPWSTPASNFAYAVTADDVTRIWTDFDGYWVSSESDASVGISNYALDFPDTSHNLLAFDWEGTTYSTGVNDAELTTNGVSFTADEWFALPIQTVTSISCDSAESSSFGVVVGSTVTTAPEKEDDEGCYSAAELAAFLTSGNQGLNLGEALVNVPSDNARDFEVTAVFNDELDDGVPDILLTQIASASSNAGQTVSLLDSNDNVVGNTVNFNGSEVQAIDPVGFWDTRIYRVSGNYWQTGKRAIRLWALELSDFGLTSANSSDISTVRWQATSTEADIAFLAYNTTALSVKQTQSISWSPNTALTLNDSPTTLSASLSVGDGTLGYSVVSAGTTGCSISGNTLTFTAAGSGADGCVVRPTATGTDDYFARTDADTVTFSIELNIESNAPDVLLVDPRSETLDFPALTFGDSDNAMICFTQVDNNLGESLVGSPSISVGRTSEVAGVTENASTNLWRFSGTRSSVQSQTGSIHIAGLDNTPLAPDGSKWLRINITARTANAGNCSANDVEVSEIVEIRPVALNRQENRAVDF